jgi:hypothetical protein
MCQKWGVITACTVAIHNKGELFALRFLVGAAEAFVQGGVFCWFPILLRHGN